MNLEVISILLFMCLMLVLAFLDRKHTEFKYGIIVRKTKKGKRLIVKFAKKHKFFLKYLGVFIVGVCFIASFISYYFLLRSAYNIFKAPTKAKPEVKLLLPQPSGVKFPGFVQGVPFWYWIIAIFIVIVAHEPMHALFAVAEKVELKDMGIFLIFGLPLGAFANPDEQQLKKLKPIKKMKIYAAGSFGNFIIALIVLFLLISSNYVLNSTMRPVGISFESTLPNTPAHSANLRGRILKINDNETKSIYDLANVMDKTKPGEKIKVITTEGVFQLTLIENPDNPEIGYMGIKNPRTVFAYKGMLRGLGLVPNKIIFTIGWTLGLFQWLFIINLGVGMANLFPLKPLDGGLMFEELFKIILKRKDVTPFINWLSLLTVGLIIINLLGPGIFSLL
jgi:membrane-associated protease RseP (regulator of RpoE activity)